MFEIISEIDFHKIINFMEQQEQEAEAPMVLPSELEQEAQPIQQIVEVAGAEDSEDRRYCILSLEPNLSTTQKVNNSSSQENAFKRPVFSSSAGMKGKPGPTAVQQLIISQQAALAENAQPTRSKSSTHFHNSRVLSPQAETSQRIFFSGKYKDLATNMQDGGRIRARLSHGAFSNVVAAPPSQMIVPDVRSSYIATPKQAASVQKPAAARSKARVKKTKANRAPAKPIVVQPKDQPHAILQGSLASTLPNHLNTGETAHAVPQQARRIGGRPGSPASKFRLNRQSLNASNHRPQRHHENPKNINRDLQNLTHQPQQVLQMTHGGAPSPSANSPYLNRSAVVNYAAAALALAQTQQSALHAVSSEDLAAANSADQEAPLPKYHTADGAALADDYNTVLGNAVDDRGVVPIQIQMRVTADHLQQVTAAQQKRSVTNPDLITQMTLERKGSAKQFGSNRDGPAGVAQVPHQCDISSQVQRNLKVNHELRNAKRLMPLYKEMMHKVAVQETSTHQARKAPQQVRNGRQQRKKSANKRAAAALKGMSDAMGIKKLGTLTELRQQRKQTLPDEPSGTDLADGNQVADPPNPTTNIEITSSQRMDTRERPQTADQRPVSQVTVSRNGTPLGGAPAQQSSQDQLGRQVQSTVLLSGTNQDRTGEFVAGFTWHEPKPQKLHDKVKQGVSLLKNQRNKIKELLSQPADYPMGKLGSKVSPTPQQTRPTRNNGRRIILTENIRPASIGNGQVHLTANALQKLLHRSDSQGNVIQTSDLLQIQRITPEQNSNSSASFSAHSKSKQILAVLGEAPAQIQQQAASMDQREKNTKPLLTHYQGVKKSQRAGEAASAEGKQLEMGDAQREILKIRAQNEDMLELFYQGKKQLPKRSIVSKTTTNAAVNDHRSNSKRSISIKSKSKSNSVRRQISLNNSHQGCDEKHVNLQVVNRGSSPYQTFNVADQGKNYNSSSPPTSNSIYHQKQFQQQSNSSQRRLKEYDLIHVNGAGLQRLNTEGEQDFPELKSQYSQKQNDSQERLQAVSGDRKSQSRGRKTIDLKGAIGVKKIGVQPLSSKRTVQQVSKGISCSFSHTSDWLKEEANRVNINMNRSFTNGQPDEQSDYDDQELLGEEEEEHIKLHSIMQPNTEALSSRRSSTPLQHKLPQQQQQHQHCSLKAGKKKGRVPNKEGTQLLKQRVSHTSHSGSIKRIVMQKKGTGPASTPDGGHYMNQEMATGSDIATIQSRNANPNANQDSFVKLQKSLKQNESGQNSRTTLKIRIKIEKNHQVNSSRSSSINNMNKKSLTATLESCKNADAMQQQENVYPNNDPWISTQSNNVTNLTKYRVLKNQKSSGASTLRHQNSVLTSLHPSVRNLHAQDSIFNLNQNLPDGQRPNKWLSRVVSHQQVVQNWLNNSSAEIPELVDFQVPAGQNASQQQLLFFDQAHHQPAPQHLLQQYQTRAHSSLLQPSNHYIMLGEESNTGVDMFNNQIEDGEEVEGSTFAPQCIYDSGNQQQLTDGVDNELISQIRKLTKEYKKQSREQFKRYQYTGHKAASASAKMAGPNANRAQRGHSSNVYQQYKEGKQNVYQDHTGGQGLGNPNWSPARRVRSKHVLEGDTGTNQDYLSKLQVGSYLNTPLNQSHQGNRGNIFLDTTKDSYNTNASNQHCVHHRKSLLQPLISSTQKYSQTAMAKRNILLRQQYNAGTAASGQRGGGSATAAGVVKQQPAGKQGRTSAGRMKIKGTQLSSAMVSMGTASTSGLTNNKKRQSSNKSPFTHCMRNSAATPSSHQHQNNQGRLSALN